MIQILRLTQISPSQGKYNVRIELLREGEFTQTADVSFDFNLSLHDQERLRWYFEDYLQYPQDPAPIIAGQIEEFLAKIGVQLFDKIFKSNFDAHKIWSYAIPQLNDTRIEIVTDILEANAIPWELICDPDTLHPLALSAASFMRTYSQAAIPPKIKRTAKGPIRILLAICRPDADSDVPFRSVASRVISGLSKEGSSSFQLDLLRPPTFDQLGRVLRRAKDKGESYHVFHFDGHGTYADLGGSSGFGKLSRDKFVGMRPGPCGYLIFENPSQKENMELVDGTKLGNLLREADVPILVLNACRSAYAESPNEPVSAQNAEQMDAHSRVRAFGSLAQEVMHAGVSGVVAMRYVVYVVTAAQFMAELYDSLVLGGTLEEAVNLGRKHLYDRPQREIAFRERELQDWSVPVVFGAGTIALFPKQNGERKFEIKIKENEPIPERGYLDKGLPPSPDTGFFGRDETLQAIDRAFDSHKVILLHAYAGSGKTSTAAEFARWYSLTGGVDGPVLFTSFERHMPLQRVLDKLGQVFGNTLEQQGIHWLTLDDDQRRALALQILKKVPVLWIWDNVEPVAGFPMGMESAWSTEEQQDLVNFLRAARDTQAKFLLTSRREEREWLGDLPRRVSVPPMPMLERVELARAIADRQGHRMIDVENLRPLLKYTEGNPLTITVLVGQSLREGLESIEQINGFVEILRSGETAFLDEADQSRSKSLGASLSYGFEHAFSEPELRALVLLRFFQGFVNVDILRIICRQGEDWSLSGLQDMDRGEGQKLLDRAAAIGQLISLGEGYYRIHPALPWFFQRLFRNYYGSQEDRVTRAFVEGMSIMGFQLNQQYSAGRSGLINNMFMEESNLLYARCLALEHNWHSGVIATMMGLHWLYFETGRLIEWERLVGDILPVFVDPKTEGPFSGLEEWYFVVIDYQVELAISKRQWSKALKLKERILSYTRQEADVALGVPAEKLDEIGKIRIQNYARSLFDLARIQFELRDTKCVQNWEKTFQLAIRIGNKQEAASSALELGNIYKDLPDVRDLDQADGWYLKALDLRNGQDLFGMALIYPTFRTFDSRFLIFLY